MSALVGGAYWAAVATALRLVVPTEGIDLRDTLIDEQREWWDLEPESRKLGLLCSRRAGKSVLFARWLVAGAVDAGEDEYCLYVSVTRKSAAENMWPEIKRSAIKTGRPHVVNESALMITFAGGGCVLVGGCETVRDLERYRGKAYRRVAIDECGALRDALLRKLYKDVLEPGTLDVGGWIAFGGTPGYVAQGLWYELTRDGAEEQTGIPIRRWTCLDNPHLLDPRGFLERIKRENGRADRRPTVAHPPESPPPPSKGRQQKDTTNMSNTRSTNLRAQADRLLEHYPGEHAAWDSISYVLGIPSRHDVRRSLEAEARRIESNGGET